MKEYADMPINEAYRLIGHGPVVLVSTCSSGGKYDIAPISWNCPVDNDPPLIILAVDRDHTTFKNIKESKECILIIPHKTQVEIVKNTGACSGREIDKLKKFNIQCFNGRSAEAKIIKDCIGYMECRLKEIVKADIEHGLIIVECIYAAARKDVYRNKRLLTESAEGKTLHHLGNNIFTSPSDEITE